MALFFCCSVPKHRHKKQCASFLKTEGVPTSRRLRTNFTNRQRRAVRVREHLVPGTKRDHRTLAAVQVTSTCSTPNRIGTVVIFRTDWPILCVLEFYLIQGMLRRETYFQSVLETETLRDSCIASSRHSQDSQDSRPCRWVIRPANDMLNLPGIVSVSSIKGH